MPCPDGRPEGCCCILASARSALIPPIGGAAGYGSGEPPRSGGVMVTSHLRLADALNRRLPTELDLRSLLKLGWCGQGSTTSGPYSAGLERSPWRGLESLSSK